MSRLTNRALTSWLHGLPGVDQVGCEARAAGAGHPLDQDHEQGLGHRHRHLDDRPHHPRGRRHPRQGALACAPRPWCPTPPTRPPRGRPRSASTATWSPPPRRPSASSGIHVAAVATAFPSRAARACRSSSPTPRDAVERRRRRDRHGHRPRRVPRGRLPHRLQPDRRGEGRPAAAPTSRSSWRPASWSPTTTSAAPRGCRCSAAATSSRPPPARSPPAATLPVTLDHARGRARLARAHRRAGRREAGRRHPHQQGRHQVPRDGQRDRRRGLARPRTGSASAPRACSTT